MSDGHKQRTERPRVLVESLDSLLLLMAESLKELLRQEEKWVAASRLFDRGKPQRPQGLECVIVQ
jgi:hypothetical protein